MNRGVHISREDKYSQAEIVALIRNELGKLNDKNFPIGYIWMSTVDTDPSTIVGGIWQRIEDTFLLAAGTNHSAGSIGGAETVTLTESQIPAHTHGSKSLVGSVYNVASQSASQNFTYAGIARSADKVEGHGYAVNSASANDGFTLDATHEHTSVGGGGAHNNMPPYLTVYMWERTG